MTKKTLGSVVKDARDRARLSQREIAEAVGIKASHIAYIEQGQRRPSISLINRLGEARGLDAKELLVLAHPEVEWIVDEVRPSGRKSEGAWQRFVSNKALLSRHAVTPSELKVSEARFNARGGRASGTFHLHPECYPAGGRSAVTRLILSEPTESAEPSRIR
jgi:transcriptional regulator with XRE-family HTH domain